MYFTYSFFVCFAAFQVASAASQVIIVNTFPG